MSTATQTPPPETEVRMTFGEHLEELRWRLVKSLIAFGVVFVAAAFLYEKLIGFVVKPHYRVMEWLKVPAEDASLISGSYTKPIWAAMKLAFIVAVVVASPIIAYQIWRFVAAGLYPRERKYVARYAPVSFLLFAVGCVFGYLVLIPYGLYGMAQMFDLKEVKPMYVLTDYLDLVMSLTIVTGVVFQLPLIMAFCSAIGLTTWRTWIRWIRFAVVAIFIAAAILTPTP
ncbi:MAG TPA: twin-arginine translocase subunit TatC, partial [Planctomycetota bacterium]|nr:twin-arginine translocase subunit TatC [Planctomycetota bacterium]